MAFTRRDFIRIGAVGGTVAAAGLTTNWWDLQAHPIPNPKTDGDHVVPSFCELCFWKCGVLAHVKDGKVTKITELKQSRPLQGPDGMRPIDGKRLIIAEGNGRTAIGVPDGDNIAITTLKEGGMEGGTPAVTVTKGMGWTIEGKLSQRDAKNPDADKGPFRLYPVPIPK